MHNLIFDPIRQKQVPLTPEEIVRQDTIQFLIKELNVPAALIGVEISLKDLDAKSKDRVDILVQDFKASNDLKRPWLLVECKAAGEYNWVGLQAQLNKYLQVLTPKYIMLSLGDINRFFFLDETTKRFVKIEKLPQFNENKN